MEGGISVSVEAINALESAVARLAARVDACLPDLAAKAERVGAILNQREYSLNDQINVLEKEALEADDDDYDTASYFRELAENLRLERREVRRKLDELRSALYQYRQQCLRLAGFDSDVKMFLKDRLQDLHGYLALSFEDTDQSMARVSESGLINDLQNDKPTADDDLSSFKLPRGFQWVSVDSIEETGNLPWQKVTPEQMRDGFELLKREILPAMSLFGSGLGRDWFRRHDQVDGLSYENGKERVFDAFFGDSPIKLSKGAGQSSYEIINGRHRIETARQLGWRRVPVKSDD